MHKMGFQGSPSDINTLFSAVATEGKIPKKEFISQWADYAYKA